MHRARVIAVGRWPLPALLALLAGCGDVPSPDRFATTGELVALSGADAGADSACFTCHGLDGEGNGAGTPRLAGLYGGYLYRQLHDYADGRRKHPRMTSIAKQLTQDQRIAVADYYAAMVPNPGSPTRPPPPPPKLYFYGDADRGLLPCAVCHGVHGRGAILAVPPLAGQPAAYLAQQLESWRKGERRNDPGNVMLQISRKLTEPEISALAAYASALPAVPEGRERAAASPPPRRYDPRNDASAPPRREPGSSASAT